MVWNTIAHPRMMHTQPGDLAGGDRSFSPIKFADPHKLSFYDIVVSLTGTFKDRHYILVKGDFETIKKLLFNDEVVCGAVFIHMRGGDEVANLMKEELTSFSYDSALDAIELQADENSDLLFLLSDNTILVKDPTSPDPNPGTSAA